MLLSKFNILETEPKYSSDLLFPQLLILDEGITLEKAFYGIISNYRYIDGLLS